MSETYDMNELEPAVAELPEAQRSSADPALFVTCFTTSLEEYRRMAFTLVAPKLIVMALLLLACFVLLGIMELNKASSAGFFYFIMALLAPVLLYFIQSGQLTRVYRSNSMTQNLTSTYYFFDDHVRVENSLNAGTDIPYNRLYKVQETKTHFYLMIGRNQALPILKAACEPALLDFLHKLRA